MKKRAVAYIRVSTASTAQLHSYEFQEQYWQDRFTGDKDAELVGIYADRGISGSSIQNARTQIRIFVNLFIVFPPVQKAGKFSLCFIITQSFV